MENFEKLNNEQDLPEKKEISDEIEQSDDTKITRIRWDEDLARKELAKLYDNWKLTANEEETFGPGLLIEALRNWLRRKKITPESLLGPEALADWKKKESVSWTKEIAKEQLEKIYQNWKLTAKESETFGPGLVQKNNYNLYIWLGRKKIPIESLLSQEANNDFKKQTIWTKDLAKEELSNTYSEWKSEAKEGENFSPKSVQKYNPNLYYWLWKNKISIDSLLPVESLAEWKKIKEASVWTDDLAKEELANIYSNWKLTAKEGETFGPKLVYEKNPSLYAWLRKNNIQTESLLSTEALENFEKRKTLTIDYAKEEVEKMYQNWKSTAKEGEIFGPGLIQTENPSLDYWLRKNNVQPEDFLSQKALADWKKREINFWTEERAREELAKIYSNWESTAKKRKTFGPSLLWKENVGLYQWLSRNNISVESLLPQEAISYYRNQRIEKIKDFPDAPENWLSTEKIAEDTGLSKDQVERIAQKLRKKHQDKFGKFKNKNKE